MDSKEYVKSKLIELSNKFIDDIEIKYEFMDYMNLHLIEISPFEIFDGVEFTLEEIEFEKEFKKLFEKEETLFISEESLMRVETPYFHIKKG